MVDLKNLEGKKEADIKTTELTRSFRLFPGHKNRFRDRKYYIITQAHIVILWIKGFIVNKREEASCWPQNWTNSETLTPTLKNIFQLCILKTPPLPPPLSTSACNKENILSSVFRTLKSSCYSKPDRQINAIYKQGLTGKKNKTNKKNPVAQDHK